MSWSNSGPRVAGLIGFPIGHSVSPSMQQAACDELGLQVRYEAWETPLAGLARRVESLRQSQVLGANVTVPHKQNVMPLLDELEPEAEYVGAVNTIVNRDGRLTGYNTDVTGFSRSLREDAGFEPQGESALVLGAGGAARAVVFALLRAGVRSLAIANRRRERTDALLASLSADVVSRAQLVALDWDEVALTARARDSDLVVNTTSVGMLGGAEEGRSPLPAEAFRPGMLVFDLVYNPIVTPLAATAEAGGARAYTGLPMLVYQGAAAFTLWTGLQAPVETMRKAAIEALTGRHGNG